MNHPDPNAQITCNLHPQDREQLQAMLDRLNEQPHTLMGFKSVEDVASYVLSSIAAGYRRPGSWERQLLYPLGLVID